MGNDVLPSPSSPLRSASSSSSSPTTINPSQSKHQTPSLDPRQKHSGRRPFQHARSSFFRLLPSRPDSTSASSPRSLPSQKKSRLLAHCPMFADCRCAFKERPNLLIVARCRTHKPRALAGNASCLFVRSFFSARWPLVARGAAAGLLDNKQKRLLYSLRPAFAWAGRRPLRRGKRRLACAPRASCLQRRHLALF